MLNNELKQMSQWFKVNKLSHLDDCKPHIDGLEVSRVQLAKFLGVLVDEKLSWSNHINIFGKNASENISFIYKVKHMLENNQL